LGAIADISQIAVNADSYFPYVPTGGTPTLHCDLRPNDPGANPADAPAVQGFAAQLGFRLPNMIISPFTRRHYVSHTPMDHTAAFKFVENRFIGSSAHLTPRDAAQPDLLEFFDFNNTPWALERCGPQNVASSDLATRVARPTSTRSATCFRYDPGLWPGRKPVQRSHE
jgi:phospholipase C